MIVDFRIKNVLFCMYHVCYEMLFPRRLYYDTSFYLLKISSHFISIQLKYLMPLSVNILLYTLNVAKYLPEYLLY